MSAANFSALKPEFDKRGVRLVGIGVEKLGYDEFVQGRFFTGELFIDEEKAAYKALACQANTWRNLWGLFDGEIMRLFKITKKKGFENNLKGDTNQLGGTFVFAAGGNTMYGHYQTAKSFEPSMVSIMECLRIPVPQDYDPYGAGPPQSS